MDTNIKDLDNNFSFRINKDKIIYSFKRNHLSISRRI